MESFVVRLRADVKNAKSTEHANYLLRVFFEQHSLWCTDNWDAWKELEDELWYYACMKF